MRRYLAPAFLSLLLLTSTSPAEVKSVHMKIAGYLCGN
jgi:hypothetical protein